MSPTLHSIRLILAHALALAVLLAAPQSIFAQRDQITVTARATVTAFLDEDFQLEIIIRGSQQADKPAIPPSDDYAVVGSGFMVSSGSGGAMMAHTYQVRAKHTGELVIPPIAVNVGGQVYKTNEVRVNIYDRPVSELAFSLVPAKSRVYVGEPIRLRIALRLARPEFRNPRFTLGGDGDFELQPDPLETEPPANGSLGNFPFGEPTTAMLDGRETPFRKGREVVDGIPGDYILIDQLFIARSPGRINFDRARATLGVPGRAVGQDFFGRTQYSVEDRTVASKAVTIEVLPLPTEGRPTDFSGLVGTYSLSASADHREVSVGEPLNLSVTVSGTPPISLVPSLDLSTQRALASSFRVPRDPLLPAASSPTTALFRALIRARNAEVKFIPPITLNYFDTQTGKYQTAATQPIVLTVKPSVEVGIDDEPDEEGTAAPFAPASESVMSGPYSFSGQRFTLDRAIRHPASIALALGPPIGLGVFALFRSFARRAAAHEPLRRRRRAVQTARREVERLRSTAADAPTVAIGAGRALTNLAADWFDKPRHTLTSLEARHLLATASAPAAEALAPVLTDCDRVVFDSSPDPALVTTLLDRARAALRETESHLRAQPK